MPNPSHETSALVEATGRGRDHGQQLGGNLVSIVDSTLGEDDLNKCQWLTRDVHALRILLESYGSEKITGNLLA